MTMQCHWRIEKQTDSWDCHYRCSDWAVCGEQGRGVATVINFRFTNENESDRFQLRVCPNCGVNVYKQRSWSELYAYLRLLVVIGATWCWQCPTLSRYLDSDSSIAVLASDILLSTECPDKLIDDPRRHPDIISELYLPRKQNCRVQGAAGENFGNC